MYQRLNSVITIVICAMLTLPSLSIGAISFSTNATGDTFYDGYIADPQGPATTGFVESRIDTFDFNLDGTGNAYSTAYADDLGTAYVGAEGVFDSFEEDLNTLTANSILVQQYTNNTGEAQDLSFAFTLYGPKLYISDADVFFTGENSFPEISVSYDFDVSWDAGGATTPFSPFSSSAQLSGGIASHSLDKDGSHQLSSNFDVVDPFTYGYTFDNLSRTLTSTISPGDIWIFTTSLSAMVEAPGFFTGGAVHFGDTNSLSFESAITVAPSVVPEPISSTLFIVGVATLGLRRFSKKFKK